MAERTRPELTEDEIRIYPQLPPGTRLEIGMTLTDIAFKMCEHIEEDPGDLLITLQIDVRSDSERSDGR